jgi:hypothetical protein
MGNYGETMGNYAAPMATCTCSSIDSYQEAAYELSSLRLLVCDLLKANQELRNALLKAKIDMPRSEGPQLPETPGIP